MPRVWAPQRAPRPGPASGGRQCAACGERGSRAPRPARARADHEGYPRRCHLHGGGYASRPACGVPARASGVHPKRPLARRHSGKTASGPRRRRRSRPAPSSSFRHCATCEEPSPSKFPLPTKLLQLPCALILSARKAAHDGIFEGLGRKSVFCRGVRSTPLVRASSGEPHAHLQSFSPAAKNAYI